MQDLDLVVKIAEIILFVVLSILGIYLIISVKKITSAVEKLEQNVDNYTAKAEPILNDAAVITSELKKVIGDVSAVSSDVKNQVSKVSGVVDSFKDTADSIIRFEQKAQSEIETQVFDAINLISAITKGVKSFIGAVSGSRNGSHRKMRSGSSYKDSYKDSEEDLYN
jgi:uncharacterized protein YoxC